MSLHASSDPVGPREGSDRVSRGGGWSRVAAYCRSADRRGIDPFSRNDFFGLRVALSSTGIPKEAEPFRPGERSRLR